MRPRNSGKLPDVELPGDCLTCGACCFAPGEGFVRVTGQDHARLGDGAEELVRFDGHRAYMRMRDGHCAALVVDCETGRFFCDVYDRRPDICRRLERGSPQCRGELTLKLSSARAALAE